MKIPCATIIIDLAQGEEELWANLDTKHRRSVRLARKLGVSVLHDGDRVACYALYRAMCRRSLLHPQSYDAVFSDRSIHSAMLDGEIVSFCTTIFNADMNTAAIDVGATDPKHRQSQSNTLLLWEIIMFFKRAGAVKMDLGGVDLHAPDTEGIDRYKFRWGGELATSHRDVSVRHYIWWKYARRSRFVRWLWYWKGTLALRLKGSEIPAPNVVDNE